MSDSLRPHELQHARPPCPSPTPGVYSNLCPSSQWWHPTTSSSVVPFPSCLQSFLASGSFSKSWLFASGGQSIGASASVLPLNIQGWIPLGLTGLISLMPKGLSRVFSSTTVWKHQFFGAQPSLGNITAGVTLRAIFIGAILEFCQLQGSHRYLLIKSLQQSLVLPILLATYVDALAVSNRKITL